LSAKNELRNPVLLLMSTTFSSRKQPGLAQQPLAEWLGDSLQFDPQCGSCFLTSTTHKGQMRSRDPIVDIAKILPVMDALDTGMFLCSPALCDRLESAKRDGAVRCRQCMPQLAREAETEEPLISTTHTGRTSTAPEALAHAEGSFDVDFPENPLGGRVPVDA